jgi:hypothetical protein
MEDDITSANYLRRIDEIYDQVVSRDEIAKISESLLRIQSPMSEAPEVKESSFGSSNVKKTSAFKS